ncbi:MAG TPA: hypothetical protein PKL29_00510 [Methanothrix sp.]|nr:hypothetical protein [Methanothrix sp.]
MNSLPGWDGPECIAEGVFRYSKYISWIRLYIDVVGSETCGGTSGAGCDIEVTQEDGRWMRYATVLASTPAGEPVLRLRGYSTWDVVYERISKGIPLDEELHGIEDLAAFLERCIDADM